MTTKAVAEGVAMFVILAILLVGLIFLANVPEDPVRAKAEERRHREYLSQKLASCKEAAPPGSRVGVSCGTEGHWDWCSCTYQEEAR